jgi:BirA family transcriptional regulator, biotin operon repressor / biotin---[acetyl-CoA-carboxylase] ligase
MIGHQIIHVESIGSTNDYALQLAADPGRKEGLVVRTDEQTAGRGQRGTSWVAEPRANLLLSVLLRPVWLPVQDQFRLSVMAALAVHDAFCATLRGVGQVVEMLDIKWPNDLWLGSRKVGGILIQNTIGDGGLEASVVGIGLNINQIQFPPEASNATSLALATGQLYDLSEVLTYLLEALEQRYIALRAGHWPALLANYYLRLKGYGQLCTWVYAASGQQVRGVVKGITSAGLLEVEVEGGEVVHFEVKEVKWVG